MYHNKVTLSLILVERLGNQAHNCKMYYSNKRKYQQFTASSHIRDGRAQKNKTKRKKTTTTKNWACQNQKFLEDVRKFSLSTMCSLVMPHSVISCGVDLLIQFFCHNYHHLGLAYPIHLLRPENFKNFSSSADVYCFQMAFNIFNFLNECFTCK